MDVYIPLGLLLALFSFIFGRNPKNQNLVFSVVFLVILVFSVLRFGFGPDYYSYWDIWTSLQGAYDETYAGVGSSIEPLFLRILAFFPRYSYFIAVSSLLFIASYFLLFRKYVSEYLWIVVLFLFFNSNCLLGNYVAMRTMLCGFLFIIAFYFLTKGDVKSRVIYALIIILASRIHSSSIVLLLLVFLNHNQKSILYNWYFVAVVGLFSIFSVLIGNNIVVSGLSSLLIDNIETFDRYQEYELGNVSSSVMALLFRVVSLAIVLYLVRTAKNNTETEDVIIYKIAIIAALIQLFFGQSLVSDRYLMIINPFYIIAIVKSFKIEKSSLMRVMISVFVLGISMYLFNVKIGKDYSASFLHYQTIFSQPIIP